MGERKVVNKYIPADFDPKLVPRGNKLSKKDGTVPVRMMLPFSVQCDTCHTFLYRGRKFNSKKEAMGGPDGRYLGIQRWRFYIKCTHCSRTLSFLTDPKNADYEMESGGTRNYEVYKDKEKIEEDIAAEKVEEEKIDPMKALENRVLDSQREMADLDNLEEIKAMNRRHVQLLSVTGEGFDADTKAVFAAREAKLGKTQKDDTFTELGTTEEEEQLIKNIKFGRAATEGNVVRLSEEDEKKEEERLQELQRELATKAAASAGKTIPLLKVKRKKPISSSKSNATEATKKTKVAMPAPAPSGCLAGLLGGYGSDSDSD